jgi:glycosyltransferase involved in cell wall biosynthesis
MRTSESEERLSDGPRHRSSESPTLSVVVSVRNAKATLRESLAAVRNSILARDAYELIVVDDASTDGSAAIAARFADTVVKLSGRPAGPAYARNRGVELARGNVIVFVGADVVVRPDTLSQMFAMLVTHPDVDAVSACHDENSGAPNFVSQYWNLLSSFGEKRHPGKCAQLTSGCCAVRRNAFLSAGMYDEWRFATGCVESVELGDRLASAGHGVLLSANLKVVHLKRWDVASVAKEVWHRSKSLARSLGYVRMSVAAPSEVVFTLTRTLTPAVALVGTLMLAAAFVPSPHALAKIGLALAVIVLTNLPLYRYYTLERGFGFAIISAPLHTFVQAVAGVALCAGWVLRDVFGDVSPDATTQAYSEVGLETWPPIPRKL